MWEWKIVPLRNGEWLLEGDWGCGDLRIADKVLECLRIGSKPELAGGVQLHGKSILNHPYWNTKRYYVVRKVEEVNEWGPVSP